MPALVGVADDFTGAADQAGMLARAGASSVLVLDPAFPLDDPWEAVTYASRLRSVPVPQAKREARELFARAQAQALAPHMIQYKYCSTFDSTPQGNIGPILDVALDACGTPGTIVVPALPVNGRTTCHGYHFVLGLPLHESPMKDHPLNPMTDSNLGRWLGQQTRRGVGLVTFEALERGPRAVREALEAEWAAGRPYTVVDCLHRRHARIIAGAVWDLPLISGSSALPLELPAIWRREGVLGPRPLTAAHRPAATRAHEGKLLALAGSCAAQTLRQVAAAGDFVLVRPELDMLLAGKAVAAQRAVRDQVHVLLQAGDRPLVASSMAPPDRAALQARAAAAGMDARQLGLRIEKLLGSLAAWAVAEAGVRQLLVAGGETSGAVCQALGLRAVEIIREIAPGVPLCRSLPDRELTVALKGGNFGTDDFFARATALATKWG